MQNQIQPMKTIALVHYRLILRGGLESRFINYMHYLVQQGYEVTMICTKKAANIEIPKGVKVVVLKVRWMPKPFRMLYFNYRLRHFMRQHTFDLSLALERTYSQDVALAPSNHLGFLKAMGKKGGRLKDKIQTYLDRKTYEQAKIIFACSDMIKTELVTLFRVAPSKIKVLYPPTNLELFKRPTVAEKRALKAKFGMSSAKYTFAFVSSSHKRKGLPLLLKIFQQLENEPFELFIAGHPKLTTSLKNVHFLGFLEKPRDLYAAVDFTIHPARYEPYGQIITESIQCGTPVIVSHMVGAKEIITPSVGVVLSDFQVDTWVNCLRNLKPTAFNIPMDYVEKRALSLEKHVETILKTWKEISL